MFKDPHCDICQGIHSDIDDYHVIYENDVIIAVLEKHSVTTGHTLIIPKEHSQGLFSLYPETMDSLMYVMRRVAVALENEFEPEGFSIFHTTSTFIQWTDHTHVHLIPRYEDDSIGLSLHTKELSNTELKQIKERLSEWLESTV